MKLTIITIQMNEYHYPNQVVILPVVSNISYVFAAVTMIARFQWKYMFQAADLIILALLSCLHHLCNWDKDILSYCATNADVLAWLDDFYAISAINICFMIHFEIMPYKFLTLIPPLLPILTLLLLIYTNPFTTAITILVTNITLFLLKNIMECFAKNLFFIPALLFGIAGYICKHEDAKKKDIYLNTDLYHYELFHSLWHVFSGLALIFLILAKS
jgi:hypothetical protein